MRVRKVILTLGIVVSACLSTPTLAGGASASTLGDGGRKIDKINRHALKSAVLVRQLLAQNGVIGMPAAK